MKVSYSKEAVQDLIRLREFIEIKNSPAAQRTAASIKKGISQLKEFPRLGKKVDLATDPNSVRDLISEKIIYILRVWHHKEDL